jgi:hypothetical protein
MTEKQIAALRLRLYKRLKHVRLEDVEPDTRTLKALIDCGAIILPLAK